MGCGCKEKQELLNKVIPGSGDALKKILSSVGIHQKAETATWVLIKDCGKAQLMQNGTKFRVWEIIGGKQKNAHTICCGALQRAKDYFEELCRS